MEPCSKNMCAIFVKKGWNSKRIRAGMHIQPKRWMLPPENKKVYLQSRQSPHLQSSSDDDSIQGEQSRWIQIPQPAQWRSGLGSIFEHNLQGLDWKPASPDMMDLTSSFQDWFFTFSITSSGGALSFKCPTSSDSRDQTVIWRSSWVSSEARQSSIFSVEATDLTAFVTKGGLDISLLKEQFAVLTASELEAFDPLRRLSEIKPKSKSLLESFGLAARLRSNLSSDGFLFIWYEYGHMGDLILRHLQHLKPTTLNILDSSSSNESAWNQSAQDKNSYETGLVY